MTDSKWRIKVPGKLMIAGEYAVLEPNQPAVVIAIDRYITAQIERSKKNSISLPQLGVDFVTWRNEGNQVIFNGSVLRLKFIQQAIMVLNQFLQEKGISQKPSHLMITSDLDDGSGRKYGLGSSAAIVVAVIAATLAFYRVRLSGEEIFKLSAIAHLKAQGNGSGADIAASTFGGWIYYTAFRPSWILNELHQGTKINELIEIPWHNLTISPLTPPPEFNLCVGWTEEVARTGPMVNSLQKYRLSNPKRYDQFLAESSSAVTRLVKSFKKGDYIGSMESISQNRQALRRLGECAHVPIETYKLKRLSELAERFGTGKSSGAGGGDCGIAFVNGKSQIIQLHQAWQKEGIQPLPLQVSKNGLVVTQLITSLKENSHDDTSDI